MRRSRSSKFADPVLQCSHELGLRQDQLHLVRKVQAQAADLPMGGKEDLEDLLYKKVRGAEYPDYCNADGSFKTYRSGIAFWFMVGKLLWTIVVWWINREHME